jgi:hypothetical protein
MIFNGCFPNFTDEMKGGFMVELDCGKEVLLDEL